jgi:hypothetical protein
VSEQRIYHLTHLRNLAAILARGSLLADGSVAGGIKPAIDISAPVTREARRTTPLVGQEATIADYVPFFLSPNASVWDSIRSRQADARLAPEVAGYSGSEFIMLVSTVKAVFARHSDGVAVSDGDATGTLTRFGTERVNAERMLQALRADEGSERILDAEFLVREEFPFAEIALIGVSDEKVRDLVKPMLAAGGHRTKVAVYPPWFKPVEDTER